MRLQKIPVTLEEANAFIKEHHRHHQPLYFHKFSIGAVRDNEVVGIVMVNRPVARHRDDGMTLEVVRLCVRDNEKNACSFLYGAAAKATFALGYTKIGTYILKDEPGTSLKAAGWRLIGERGGGSWSRPLSGRPRVDTHPTEQKQLWELER